MIQKSIIKPYKRRLMFYFHITTRIELKRLHSDDREELMLRLLLFKIFMKNIANDFMKFNAIYAVTNSYKEFIAL